MRGEVVHYDEAQGFGFINGADGKNYSFRREDLRRATPMAAGDGVEFEPNGGQAKGVFAVRALGQAAAPLPAAGTATTGSQAHAHFGRNAADYGTPAGTSLWFFFWRSLTANYVQFRGRARRKEYWGYFLFWMIGFIAVIWAGIAVDTELGNLQGTAFPFVTVSVSVLFILITLLPGIALTVRRMHDIGLSGWFYLLVFVPYIGSLVLFVFSLIPSQAHDNKWGPVPEGIIILPPYAPSPTI